MIHNDVIADVIAYENGEQEEQDTVVMFQRMINDGTAWRLQGSYGREAMRLLEYEVKRNRLTEEDRMTQRFKLTGNTCAVRQRQKVEQTIARAVVDALLAAGFLLGVYDGEELVVHHTRDRKAILDALFNTDEDYLYVYYDDDSDDPTNVLYDPRPDYWVRFMYGNDGWDVMSDYTVSLEPYIGEGTAVDKLIEKYAG